MASSAAVTAALVVFVASYLVIAGTRLPFVKLDRPAGAVLGATAMVLLGVVSSQQVVHEAVSWDTILLLLGMMIVTSYLAEAAVFRWVSWKTLTHVRTSRGLLVAVVFVAGGLSALLVNDTICLMLTPLVVQLAADAGRRPLPFLLALAFGSNAGSVATPTGNPQNMIVGTLSGIDYAHFAMALTLPALVSLVVVAVVLLVAFRHELSGEPLPRTNLPPPPIDTRLAWLCLFTLTGLVAAFFLGNDLAWSAMAAASFLLLAGAREPRGVFERVDWVLLLFFAGLFVIVHGVATSGLSQAMFDRLQPLMGRSVAAQSLAFGTFTVLASQLVSNVPFVLLAAPWIEAFQDPTFMWLSTALFATLAGNLTPIGSVANVIVLEGAREHGRIPFVSFFKLGAVVTVLTLAAGWGVLLLERALGWV